jgi:hypothetical protein
MSTQQDCNHICPECRDGKHRNCSGVAWCDLMDAETECACLDCEWGQQ